MAEYATYREMPKLLERRKEFRGNSVRAFKDWEGNYIVMSYDTIIYAQCAGGWYFDNTFYSPTTSKLQNLLIWNVLPAMFGRYQRKAYVKGDSCWGFIGDDWTSSGLTDNLPAEVLESEALLKAVEEDRYSV